MFSSVRSFLLLLVFAIMSASAVMAQDIDASQARTADPSLSLEALDIMLVPLPVEDLKVEAEAWRQILQDQVQAIGENELKRLPWGDPDNVTDPELLARFEAVHEELSEQRKRRSELIEHLNLVLFHIVEKSGVDEAKQEPEFVRNMRMYIDTVDGLRASTVENRSLGDEVEEWIDSPEGGKRLLRRVLIVPTVVVLAWFLGWLLARGMIKGVKLAGRESQMLSTFLRRNIPKACAAFGLVLGLVIVGFHVAPLVALIGGLSFVLAFALQESLGNFASGFMIMFYQPFDIGDYINAAGVEGTVKEMTLVNTSITTVDNKLMVVPNNAIWNDVITNVTGVTQRRVDLVFGIGYADDMDKAQAIMEDVIAGSPNVLAEPKPVVRVHELGDSSVNFICRPWVKPEDYWETYWDITRRVKERFDAEGVSIPFPQRDLHVFTESVSTGDSVAGNANAKGGAPVSAGDEEAGKTGASENLDPDDTGAGAGDEAAADNRD